MKTENTDHAFPNNERSDGLTKLEYFAGQAMQGLIANQDPVQCRTGEVIHDLLATMAVDYAEALIYALNRVNHSTNPADNNVSFYALPDDLQELLCNMAAQLPVDDPLRLKFNEWSVPILSLVRA